MNDNVLKVNVSVALTSEESSNLVPKTFFVHLYIIQPAKMCILVASAVVFCHFFCCVLYVFLSNRCRTDEHNVSL